MVLLTVPGLFPSQFSVYYYSQCLLWKFKTHFLTLDQEASGNTLAKRGNWPTSLSQLCLTLLGEEQRDIHCPLPKHSLSHHCKTNLNSARKSVCLLN